MTTNGTEQVAGSLVYTPRGWRVRLRYEAVDDINVGQHSANKERCVQIRWKHQFITNPREIYKINGTKRGALHMIPS